MTEVDEDGGGGGGGERPRDLMAGSVISKRSIALDMYIKELASYFKQNCSPYNIRGEKTRY